MRKLVIKNIFVLDMEHVRIACIDNKWYTRGNSEDYDAILKFVEKNKYNMVETPENVLFVAQDIYHHSAGFNHDEPLEDYEDNLEYICNRLLEYGKTMLFAKYVDVKE